MKSIIKIKWFALLAVLLVSTIGYAQSEVQSEFSYSVTNGPIFPITGSTYQVTGQVHLKDSTLDVQDLNFDVWLNSLTGFHSDYLAWLGNANTYPNLKFKSEKVEKKGEDAYKISGQLEFRGLWMPQDIIITESKTANEYVLEGSFQLNINNYFTFSPPLDIVPAWIPMKITLVFDKEMITLNPPVPKPMNKSTKQVAK